METCLCSIPAEKPRPVTYWLPFHYHRIPGPLRLWLRAKLFPRYRLTPANPLCLCQEEAQRQVRWPAGKQAAFTLSLDVDSATGLRRALELRDDPLFRDRKVTVNILTDRYPLSEAQLSRLGEPGWEIGLHGDNHDARLPFQPRKQIELRLERSLAKLEALGITPRGFRSPSLLYTEDLFRALEGRVAYSSSTAYDDGPFSVRRLFPYRRGGLLELPITMPMDIELRSLELSAQEIADLWLQRYRYILRHGGHALMVAHPDAHCFDGRVEQALRSFLERMEREAVWEANCGEVSDFFHSSRVSR